MKKSMVIFSSLLLSWIIAVTVLLGTVGDLVTSNVVYKSPQINNQESYNVKYEYLGETDRKLATVVSDGGLDESGVINAYPQYGKDARYTAEQKQAVRQENITLMPSNSTYNGMDSDGNLYLDGKETGNKLYKHTYADSNYYGGLSDDQQAVIKKMTFGAIKVKDNYTFVTGLYAPAGEVVKLEISKEHFEALGKTFQVIIGQTSTRATNHTIPDNNKTFMRMPDITSVFTINETNATYNQANGTYEIYVGSFFGGAIYLNKLKNIGSQYSITISGAVEYSHYILGVTSLDDWNRVKESTAPYFDLLVVDKTKLGGPAKYARADGVAFSYQQITKTAQYWYSVALTSKKVSGASSNDWGVDIFFDTYVRSNLLGGGVAVKGANFCTNDDRWFGAALNYQSLMQSGDWGNMHEFNHHYQEFGTSNITEVTNNAVTLLEYSMYTDISSNRNADQQLSGWLRYQDPTVGLKEVLQTDQSGGTNYNLSSYSVLVQSFTPDQFLQTTRTKGNDNYYKALSYATKQDMTYYFTQLLNINISQQAIDEIKAQYYPMFVPVAISYQTGRGFVDNQGNIIFNSATRPYAVDFSQPFEIDFNKYLVLPEGFSFKVEEIKTADQSNINDSITKTADGVYQFTSDASSNSSRKYYARISLTNDSVDFELKDVYIELQFQDINNKLEFEMPYKFTTTVSSNQKVDLGQAKVIDGENIDPAQMNEPLFDDDLSTGYVNEVVATKETPAVFVIDLGISTAANKLTLHSPRQYGSFGFRYGADNFLVYAGLTLDNMKLVADVTNALDNGYWVDTKSEATFELTAMRYLKVVVTRTEYSSYEEKWDSSRSDRFGINGIELFTTVKTMSINNPNVYYSINLPWTINYDLLSTYGHIYESHNGSIMVNFSGSVFSIICYVGKEYGKLYISIDGGEEIVVDLSADNLQRQMVFVSAGYELGSHTVRIRGEGKVNVESFQYI